MADVDLIPEFIRSKRLDVSIDTSGFCQARCENCVWPSLKKSRTVLSLEDFKTVLERFDGYQFGEFAFNSINEPFTDRTILDKLDWFIERRISTDLLFFSSNWLIPKSPALIRTAQSVESALAHGVIKKVSLNATISGIDQESYDILQGGLNLDDAIMPYKSLDFELAVARILELLQLLEQRIEVGQPYHMRLKCYGFLFDDKAYRAFWMERLLDAGLSPDFIKHHVRIHMNHGFTTFARSDPTDHAGPKRCSMNWLDQRLVIGPRATVGLCCHEGAHLFNIGSLLSSTLQELVVDKRYQRQMRIIAGVDRPEGRHPCRNCEFYLPIKQTAPAEHGASPSTPQRAVQKV